MSVSLSGALLGHAASSEPPAAPGLPGVLPAPRLPARAVARVPGIQAPKRELPAPKRAAAKRRSAKRPAAAVPKRPAAAKRTAAAKRPAAA
jgi:hypothetical protein